MTDKSMIYLELPQDQAELLLEGLETAIRNQAGALSFIMLRAKEAGAQNDTELEDLCLQHATELRRTVNNLDDLADNLRRVIWYNEDQEDY